jgi:hypothetical protein
VCRQVDAVVAVAVARADREEQPGFSDTVDVRLPGIHAKIVVIADRRVVGEAGGVAEQVAQGDFVLGALVENAVDVEVRQVLADGCVQIDQAFLDSQHHRRGCERFGHGLDAEGRIRCDRRAAGRVGIAKPLRPNHLIIIDDGDRHAGDALFAHLFRDELAVFCDDRFSGIFYSSRAARSRCPGCQIRRNENKRHNQQDDQGRFFHINLLCCSKGWGNTVSLYCLTVVGAIHQLSIFRPESYRCFSNLSCIPFLSAMISTAFPDSDAIRKPIEYFSECAIMNITGIDPAM